MRYALKRWAVGLAVVAAAGLGVGLSPRAEAAAHTYNNRVQSIRCGVLLANRGAWADRSQVTGTGFDMFHQFSYVFQALNARADIRPFNWDLVNPNAAPYMDWIQARRYGLQNTNSGGANYFDANSPPRLNKNYGAYWEVYLHETSVEQLSNYDVLYMPLPLDDTNGDTGLTPVDRENLRRAVDAGTILWIDNPINRLSDIPGSNFPPSPAKMFVQPAFQAANGFQFPKDPLQALLSEPNPLSAQEVRRLGNGGNNNIIAGVQLDANSGTSWVGWKPVVTLANGRSTVAVYSYGQGAIVVTSRGVGTALSSGFRPVAGLDGAWRNGNTGPVCGSDASRVPIPELKFLVNLLSYKFQSPQPGNGPRHGGGSRQDLNTPLGRKWELPDAPPSGGFANSQYGSISDPAVWNGIVYAATADGFVRAYDVDPDRDLDGDGNPDDGRQNRGASADVIWQAQLPSNTGVSSLVVGDVGGKPYVFGMLSNGSVFAIDALPRGANGRLLPTANITVAKVFAPYDRGIGGRLAGLVGQVNSLPGEELMWRIPAPVYYNGRLFCVGISAKGAATNGIGGVAEIDLSRMPNLTPKWIFPDTTAAPTPMANQTRLGIPSATPTIAAIPDKGPTGATDILLLVPCLAIRPQDVTPPVTPQGSRVYAFPIGVRGEHLVPDTNADGDSIYLGRLSGMQSMNVDPSSIFLYAPGMNPVQGTAGTLPANRQYRMYFAGAPNGMPDVWADYDFLPGPPANGFQGYNARWYYEAWAYNVGSVSKYMEILTSPVVASDGSIYWVASDIGEGVNQSPVVMGVQMKTQNLGFDPNRNPLYIPQPNQPQLTFMYGVSSQGVYGTQVQGTGTGGLGGVTPVPQAVVIGTPAVDRGILYAPWYQVRGGLGIGGGGANDSIGGVTGFYVQGTRFGLLLASPVDLTQKGSITITQKNLVTGDQQMVGSGLFDVDNITVGNELHGLITFRSLSSGPGYAAVDLSRPGDMLVTYPHLDITTNQTVASTPEAPTIYYWTSRRPEGSTNQNDLIAFNADFSNAQGSATQNPWLSNYMGVRSAVTVAGDSIYFGTDNGDIWTVRLPDSTQLAAGVRSPVRRATAEGITQYAQVNGTPLYTMRGGPIVANGTLISNTALGLFTFYSPRTLITDSNRILEVASTYTQTSPTSTLMGNAGSEVVWSLDSTTQTRDFGSPGVGPDHPPFGDIPLGTPVERGLSHPTMAIRVGGTNTLICDTGNNRVVEVDRSGNVVWQCSEFADPMGLLGPNESRSLNSPTSIQRWETFTDDPETGTPVMVRHNLIADYGNNRVLEVITRFSRDQNLWANNVLVWVGKGPEGSPYQFYQAERQPYNNPNDPDNGSLDYGMTIASVTNVSVNSADVQITDPGFQNAVTGRPATAGGSLVMLGGLKDKATNGDSASGKVVYFFNQMTLGNQPTHFPLARPVFFSKVRTGLGSFAWKVLMTDGQNVFDLVPSGVPGVANIPIETNMANDQTMPLVAAAALGTQAKSGGRGTGGFTLGTAMATRLGNNNILMVNQKTGYVFEYDPEATNPADILHFTAPPIAGTGALTRPSYAERLF